MILGDESLLDLGELRDAFIKPIVLASANTLKNILQLTKDISADDAGTALLLGDLFEVEVLHEHAPAVWVPRGAPLRPRRAAVVAELDALVEIGSALFVILVVPAIREVQDVAPLNQDCPAVPAELASTLPRCSSQAAQIRSEWRELMATTRSLSSSGNLADLGIKP